MLGTVSEHGKGAILSSLVGIRASSFLVTAAEMIASLERGGLKLVRRIALNEAYLAYLDDVRDRARRGEQPPNIDPQSLKDRATPRGNGRRRILG
jgi:hypothetical protein